MQLMRYADPYATAGQWYKGNLHTHSTASDGKLSPEELLRDYEGRGYDFLAITDHWVVVDPAPLQALTRMTLIPGFEFGDSDHSHILCLGVRESYAGSHQDVLNATAALGGVAMLNHPNWIREDYWPPQVMAGLRYYAGIEIYNSVITRLEGSPFATDDWDTLLSGGLRVWGYANEDAHRAADVGHCFNMVLAPAMTGHELLQAVEKGHCYGSTGLLFDDIGVRGDIIVVKLHEAGEVRFSGPGGQVLSKASGREADFLLGGEAYVRVEAETASGQRAWSQPFWRIGE
jgi:hypothetical protein